MKYLEILLCFTLGVVFVASSVPKLCHPRGFILVVLESRVLYPPIARLYGWMLPPLELFIALLLLSGTMVPIAASIAALFIISFYSGGKYQYRTWSGFRLPLLWNKDSASNGMCAYFTGLSPLRNSSGNCPCSTYTAYVGILVYLSCYRILE